ncbi:MAG: hypothetical protein RIS94_2171, partial [Pseudomonadota bacterium]
MRATTAPLLRRRVLAPGRITHDSELDLSQLGFVREITRELGGALATRIAALRAIAARVSGRARLTLDPSERHGFEYQTWFGFTLYAEGVRGPVGRGGTYRIAGEGAGEAATGFSLYPDALIRLLEADEPREDRVFLPLGHDADVAARLRSIGWRTVAALSDKDTAQTLGCTHVLDGETPVAA